MSVGSYLALCQTLRSGRTRALVNPQSLGLSRVGVRRVRPALGRVQAGYSTSVAVF